MFDNFAIGIISGLVTTLFVVVFRATWHSVVIPWFEERIYKDIRIEGKWFSFYPDFRDGRQEVVTLDRKGHAVTGTIVCTHGSDAGEKYNIAGSFRNMILPLTYESSETTKADRGAIALKSARNGERFVGKIAMYSDSQEVISTATVIWFREKSELEKYLETNKSKKQEIAKLQKEAREIEEKLNVTEEITKSPSDIVKTNLENSEKTK